MSGKVQDPVMQRVRTAFTESGLSLDELGKRMGSDGETAKKYAWQFLNKVDDPRVSTLRKFADAVGIPLGEFFPGNKKSRSKPSS
jgi:transcriptional regulator with XRE-family HTH domain